MGNMSYCRWENTAEDFEDCYRSLMDEDRHAVMFNAYEHGGGEEWRAKKNFINFLLEIKDTSEWLEELASMATYAEENKEE